MAKRPRVESVRVCPNCKSIDVSQDKSTLQQTGMLPTLYICNACGHSGYTFPVVNSYELKDFEKEVDKRNLRKKADDDSEQLDPSYGRFEVHIVWKITGPLLSLIGLLMLLQKIWAYGTISLALGLFMTYITYGRRL